MRALASLLILLAFAARAPAKVLFCDGEFAVVDSPSVPGGMIALDGRMIAIGSSCPPVEGRRAHGRRFRTAIKAKWRSCAGARGVRLWAKIDPSCSNMTGWIRLGRRADRVGFSAWRTPQCGSPGSSTCPCRSPGCPPDTVGRDADGDSCEDSCLPANCGSDADCGARAYCMAPPGTCAGPGVCGQRPEACLHLYDPVCGCDGITYGNACEAAAAGVRVAAEWPCHCAGLPCPSGTLPVDRDGDQCPETCQAPCGTACDCYQTPDLLFPTSCPALCPTCDSYWVCEKGWCAERCGPVPPGQDECKVCLTSEDCGPGAFCASGAGSCDRPGECRPRPTECSDVQEPVCGCDGSTYANSCDAAAAGVRIASVGACPALCGTIVGIGCPKGQFCEFEPGMCNGADLAGACVTVPAFCPQVYAPVCGCDGRTYGNDCERRGAAVQKAYGGECR